MSTGRPASRQRSALSVNFPTAVDGLSLFHRVPEPRDAAALPAHEARKAEPRGGGHALGERHHWCAGLDARAVHGDVDLDHHADPSAGVARGSVQRLYLRRIVDRDDDVGVADQAGQARELRGADDLVGDEDVADPGRSHDLGLAEFRAGDPVRARLEELVRQRGRLDALGVRAPADARVTDDDLAHPRHVALEGVEVD
jgi:hypothetical protein